MADKIPPPSEPQPAFPLEPSKEPARHLPTLDRTAIGGATTKMWELVPLCRLLPQTLTVKERQTVKGGVMTFKDEDERKINELLRTVGPQIYTTPIDVDRRESHVRDTDALDHLKNSVGAVYDRLSDTILVRREQHGRETAGYITSMISLSETNDGLAASVTVQALKDSYAAYIADRKDAMAKAANDATEDARAILEAALRRSELENQQLRTQMSAMALKDSTPPIVAPAPPVAAALPTDRRLPKR